MSNKNPQIFVIADYGKGDPAFVEVYQYLSNLIPNADVKEVCAQPFSTTHTGFWAYQIALNHANLKKTGDLRRKTYLYINTAPRRDNSSPRRDNEGEGLVYAKLNTGLEIVGVFSGETFSFLKPLIHELRIINVPKHGSQFRSRDIFPYALKDIVGGNYSCLGEQLDVSTIAEPKSHRIAHVDEYGNIKTTTRTSEILGVRPGESVTVTIGDKSVRTIYTDGIFCVKEGELCLAPGSSGYNGDRFLEVSKRYGSAYKVFGEPKVETQLRLERRNVTAPLRA